MLTATPLLSAQDRLDYEARVKTQKAAFALAAGVFLVIGAIFSLSGPQSTVNEATLQLIYEHKRATLAILNSVATSLGYGSLGFALDFLFRIAIARNDGVSRIPPWCRYFVLVGATLLFVTGPVYSIMIIHNASQFVSHGQQTYMEARTLTHGSGYIVVGILLNVGLLSLAVGFIITAVLALRVGLLPRILGWTGAIAGALVILPLGGYIAPFLQAFWLMALVWLLAGRWTSGTPQAWTTGTAVAWLSPAMQREQREAAQAGERGGRGGRDKRTVERAAAKSAVKVRIGKDDDDDDVIDDVDDEAPARTRSSTPKRKRKRRH